MMCLLLSRKLSKVALADTSSAQGLGRKSRDNLSNTYTARKPTSFCAGLRSSAALSVSMSVAISFWRDRRWPTIGARMRMPFSPRLTKRPSVFHVRIPATLVASGFCKAPTCYPCFEHRHDSLSLPSALSPDGDDGAKVFSPRTEPRSGRVSRWKSASSPRMDVRRGFLPRDGDCGVSQHRQSRTNLISRGWRSHRVARDAEMEPSLPGCRPTGSYPETGLGRFT